MTTIELKFLETVSLDAELEFNRVLGSLQSKQLNQSRYNRSNDVPVLQLFRFCLDARNKEYTLAKQSLKTVVTEY